MVIKGSKRSLIFCIILTIMVLLTVIFTVNISALLIFIAWFIYYGCAVWIQEIEIKDNVIHIKRLFKRETTISTFTITGVEFRKRSFIIYKGKYSGIGILNSQLDKNDLQKLKDYLKPYKC